MNCTFDISKCSSECPKFTMCSYNSIQNQFSEINSQLNFILNILTKISCESEKYKEFLNVTDANIKDLTSIINELTNDSEMKHLIKGVRTNEENN